MNGPLEFRINEKIPENPKEIIPSFWIKFIDSYLKKKQEKYEEEEKEEVF